MASSAALTALTARLLAALDQDYNVVDMRAIDEVISALESINITKELLETTRLGKHVNELRRRTLDTALARRTKLLVKRWRDLVIPDKAGSKPATQPTSAESTPRQSPLAHRGISPTVTPSVTPRLSSPQVSIHGLSVHKQNSLTPPDAIRLQQHFKRQPLTSPALHNLSPGLRNSSQAGRVSSPNFKNITSRINSPAQKNILPAQKIISPAFRNASPSVRNSSPRNPPIGLNLVSPALRLQPETNTIWNAKQSKDAYDSDSQDVIFVDDVDDVNTHTSIIKNSIKIEQNDKCSKRPRSPINGGPETSLHSEELRRDAKRARREISGRKAKKRRNHTKSENRTVDHSSDPVSVGSPFLPISSASTSPALFASGALRNGLSLPNNPNTSIVVDDLDSSSALDSKSKSSRKNGCKKPSVEVDNYSNFIKTTLPTGGRKVKTTKELLIEMQAKKSGKITATSILDKSTKPKKDFLTTYDTQKQLKKEAILVADIIELNDSNSSSKIIDSVPQSPTKVKEESGSQSKADVKPAVEEKVKFESVETILSRLPPIDYNWKDHEEDFTPVCTCTMCYETSDDDIKISSPKKSIFELDYDESLTEKSKDEAVSVAAMPKEKLDVHCQAGRVYHYKPADVAEYHVDALHNEYIADVNGSRCNPPTEKKIEKLACKTDEWGLRPYYDCSRDLFHNVVPKYNYLDSSLDKCVKNLNNIAFDRYEPADTITDTDEWFLSLENEHFAKWEEMNENMKCDDFDSAADSPFSEKNDDDPSTDDNAIGTHFDSDKKHSDSDSNINLDRDADASTRSPTTTTNEKTDDSTAKDTVKKSGCFEVLDYDITIPYRPFSTTYTKCLFMDDSDFENAPESKDIKKEVKTSIVVKEEDDVPSPAVTSPAASVSEDNFSDDNYESFIPTLVKKFTYEDSITLLPLSLPAINAFASYDGINGTSGDLSSIFRNRITSHHMDEEQSPKESCDLSYSLVKKANVIDMKDVASSVISRTRELCVDGLDEDANCDSDINKLELVDKLTNSGAFVTNSDDGKCVKNGCPSWIPGSAPVGCFREWHEPVVRTSYNEEPLTILPYVVID